MTPFQLLVRCRPHTYGVLYVLLTYIGTYFLPIKPTNMDRTHSGIFVCHWIIYMSYPPIDPPIRKLIRLSNHSDLPLQLDFSSLRSRFRHLVPGFIHPAPQFRCASLYTRQSTAGQRLGRRITVLSTTKKMRRVMRAGRSSSGPIGQDESSTGRGGLSGRMTEQGCQRDA